MQRLFAFLYPTADLLWFHALSALLVGMLSEVAYAALIGLTGGAAFGFLSGYARALQVRADNEREIVVVRVRPSTCVGCEAGCTAMQRVCCDVALFSRPATSGGVGSMRKRLVFPQGSVVLAAGAARRAFAILPAACMLLNRRLSHLDPLRPLPPRRLFMRAYAPRTRRAALLWRLAPPVT